MSKAKKKLKAKSKTEAKGFAYVELKGSGGGAPKSPTEQDDTAFSTSIANVVELLGEGPIQGFIGATAARAVFLDDTPIENNNGTRNFQGVKIRSRRGLQYQSEIPTITNQESETNVGVEVRRNINVTRTIINPDLDAIRIRLGIQMQRQQSDGDVVGSEIRFRISTKEGGAPFRVRRERTIRGRYSQLTEFEFEFNVRNLNRTVNNFQFRVEKLTDDSTTQQLVSILRVQSYTEIIRAKLSYPNSAIVALEFDAKQFNSVPKRSFRVGGLLCRVPSNATVRSDNSLSLDGPWDGNFKAIPVATNDPVWQLYEILTNKRFGLGNYIDPNRIDKWSLYAASQYNNAYVSDGLGGLEPRYQCSTVLQTKEKVFDVISALCSSCKMKPYWAEGTLFFWQDRPTPPIRQFTQADVENGDFVYSTTALRSRFTTCAVTWSDPQDNYKQAVELVDDHKGILRYGIRETETVAYGCVSRALANRVGRWALYSSQNDTETVNFTARAYAAFCRPGDVIQIADARRSNIRYGGLITNGASNQNQIFIDSPVPNFVQGSQLSITLNNGQIETRTVNAPFIPATVFVPTVPFSQLPSQESNWILSSPSVQPQLFRVLSVIPKSGDVTKVEITGIKYNPGKYAFIEDNISFAPAPTRNTAPVVVNVPFGLTLTASLVGGIRTLFANWSYPLALVEPPTRDPFISGFLVEYKRGATGDWRDTRNVVTNSTTFSDVATGDYAFRVASVDVNGKTSVWVESALITAT